MASAGAAASSLDPLVIVRRASNRRCYHDQLRVNHPGQLGGQSDNAVIPDPFRSRLVVAEGRCCRVRRRGGAANVSTMANSLCCIVLRYNRIGQFGLPLTASSEDRRGMGRPA
jgi:hypothetical protein